MALLFFPDSMQKGLLSRIVQFAKETAHPADRSRVFISEKAYVEAFIEADYDAHFLKTRRGLTNGLSEGKLAGVLFFRLSRHRIIHLSQEITEYEDYEHFQEKVIIRIIGSLLHIDFNDPWIVERIKKERPGGMRHKFQNFYNELLYLSCRRHYNQESLALFFDTCAYLSHAIDELRALGKAPVRS
jgi:hypothetical protein